MPRQQKQPKAQRTSLKPAEKVTAAWSTPSKAPMQDTKCKMRSVRERLLLLRNRPCSRQIDYWLPNLGPFGLRPSLRRRGDAAGCAVTIRGGAGFLNTRDCRLVPPLGDTESPECEVVIRHLYARGGRGPAEKESLKAMSNSKTRSRNKQRWAIRLWWWYLEALNFRPFFPFCILSL